MQLIAARHAYSDFCFGLIASVYSKMYTQYAHATEMNVAFRMINISQKK